VTDVDELRAQHEETVRRLAIASERWVQARALGQSTAKLDIEMRLADRRAQRLERQIRRRTNRMVYGGLR
jgi:hypothetical protein